MKIENMRKGDWGKVRAFFDVATQDGFVVKGFRLVEGINGLFVSMPSRKGSDEQGNDKWFDTVWIESRTMRDTLNQNAINEYNNASGGQPAQPLATNDQENSTMVDSGKDVVGSNVSENTEQNQSMESSSESIDDDIPF